MSDNDDRCQVMLGFYLQPVDINQPFDLVSPATQRSTIAAMHHNALIRVQKTRNLITRKGAAAIGQFDKLLRRFMAPVAIMCMPIFYSFSFLFYLTALPH